MTADANLIERCKELVAWRKTGLLSGSAIRDLAEEKWPGPEWEHDRIAQAERLTVNQALDYIAGEPTTEELQQTISYRDCQIKALKQLLEESESKPAAIIAWLKEQVEAGDKASKQAFPGSQLERDLVAGVVTLKRAIQHLEENL